MRIDSQESESPCEDHIAEKNSMLIHPDGNLTATMRRATLVARFQI
jgi:hypothetical protein